MGLAKAAKFFVHPKIGSASGLPMTTEFFVGQKIALKNGIASGLAMTQDSLFGKTNASMSGLAKATDFSVRQKNGSAFGHSIST